jgi:hypothetical protein
VSPAVPAADSRTAIGQGLLLLGLFGVLITIVFLALNWAAYEDRSDTELALLLVSLLVIATGGWCTRSARLALWHALVGVLLAALFLAITSLIAWYRSTHFFPPRSRLLLESALAAALVSGIAVLLLHRRPALGSPGGRD